MNSIGIFNETKIEIKELEIIEKLIKFALKKEKIKKIELNIIIVDNKEIKKINQQYRNINSETDVISFALEDEKNFICNSDFKQLGDIYISIEKVYEQSQNYGHSFLRELAFLSVHGLMHLLGYDHMNEEDEKVMFNKQDLILNEFGIKR